MSSRQQAAFCQELFDTAVITLSHQGEPSRHALLYSLHAAGCFHAGLDQQGLSFVAVWEQKQLGLPLDA